MESVDRYVNMLLDAISKINHDEIIQVADLIKDKKVFIFGNGGSAATASHWTVDLNKSCGVNIHCLNDNVPLITAYANDVSYNSVFYLQLQDYMKPGDVVIGISGSGNSRNILNAIDYANAYGGITVGVVGMTGGELKRIAKFSIHTPGTMEISEDMHMIVCHILKDILCGS